MFAFKFKTKRLRWGLRAFLQTKIITSKENSHKWPRKLFCIFFKLTLAFERL